MRPAPSELDDETTSVPCSVRFPVELIPPEGFDPERLEKWPRVEGRLEWVGGRLLYMPPCGASQQETVADVVITLGLWTRVRTEFVVGTNEAGMRLGSDTRAAEAAIWRLAERPTAPAGLRRAPPLLAVEVAGRDEREPELRDKARWYLEAGVASVWLVFPERRDVLVITSTGEWRYGTGERLAADDRLPGLAPMVDEFFVQVSRGGR